MQRKYWAKIKEISRLISRNTLLKQNILINLKNRNFLNEKYTKYNLDPRPQKYGQMCNFSKKLSHEA
jgi:hypothetical protein